MSDPIMPDILHEDQAYYDQPVLVHCCAEQVRRALKVPEYRLRAPYMLRDTRVQINWQQVFLHRLKKGVPV